VLIDGQTQDEWINKQKAQSAGNLIILTADTTTGQQQEQHNY